jgi:hypothetical protein
MKAVMKLARKMAREMIEQAILEEHNGEAIGFSSAEIEVMVNKLLTKNQNIVLMAKREWKAKQSGDIEVSSSGIVSNQGEQ